MRDSTALLISRNSSTCQVQAACSHNQIRVIGFTIVVLSHAADILSHHKKSLYIVNRYWRVFTSGVAAKVLI